jgi:adenosylmethionine-8-amino-7-oxononanoate aminotransferase
MDEAEIARLAALDHAHVWHPFTPMRQWREAEPLIIVGGEAEFLIDARGNRYIDGVSSLWCNVHGHRVAEIDSAVRGQLDRIAHTSALGLTNVPAIELAAALVRIAPGGKLTKVFYSDSGATATEVAFKMAMGYWFHTGSPRRTIFIALDGAYHGDTVGAMSIGYSELFHRPFRPMTFHTEFVPPDDLEALDAKLEQLGDRVAGVVIEPLVQGAAGMIVQSPGYLRGISELVKKHGTLLIADEVATGFGRTGRMFACEHEAVAPDLLCLGKGLTGGYLPLAATLATDRIAAAFEGELHEHKTLFHGHTFTANPLACAAALASLKLFETRNTLAEVQRKSWLLAQLLAAAKSIPAVADVRQCGLMAAVELRPVSPSVPTPNPQPPTLLSGSTGGDFGETATPAAHRPAHDACLAARAHGVIVRPLGNSIILVPPLCITDENLRRLVTVVVEEIRKGSPQMNTDEHRGRREERV